MYNCEQTCECGVLIHDSGGCGAQQEKQIQHPRLGKPVRVGDLWLLDLAWNERSFKMLDKELTRLSNDNFDIFSFFSKTLEGCAKNLHQYRNFLNDF